jgi:hypothetical protein
VGLKILRGVRRTLWIAFVAAGWFLLLLSVFVGAIDFVDGPRVEASGECAPGETADCFVRHEGVVTSSDGSHVDVRYDDGRRTASVTLLADAGPPVGARVRLQRWGGDVVAVYDPSLERRYRTLLWPRRWDPYAFAFALVGAAIVAAQFTRRAVRRRHAGRPVGRTPVAA